MAFFKVQESEVDIRIVKAKCIEIIDGTGMFSVCGRYRSRKRMTE